MIPLGRGRALIRLPRDAAELRSHVPGAVLFARLPRPRRLRGPALSLYNLCGRPSSLPSAFCRGRRPSAGRFRRTRGFRRGTDERACWSRRRWRRRWRRIPCRPTSASRRRWTTTRGPRAPGLARLGRRGAAAGQARRGRAADREVRSSGCPSRLCRSTSWTGRATSQATRRAQPPTWLDSPRPWPRAAPTRRSTPRWPSTSPPWAATRCGSASAISVATSSSTVRAQ